MSQPRHIVEFESSALPGQDDAYNRWYENIHVAEVLAAPGFLSCQRFVVRGGERPVYVARFEIEGEDPEAVIAAMRARPKIPTEALDRASVRMRILAPMGAMRQR